MSLTNLVKIKERSSAPAKVPRKIIVKSVSVDRMRFDSCGFELSIAFLRRGSVHYKAASSTGLFSLWIPVTPGNHVSEVCTGRKTRARFTREHVRLPPK